MAITITIIITIYLIIGGHSFIMKLLMELITMNSNIKIWIYRQRNKTSQLVIFLYALVKYDW